MFLVTRILNKIFDIKRLRDFGVKSYKWGYKKGFTASTIDVCGVTKDNYSLFLTDEDYILGHPYNGPYSAIIDNKLWLPMFLHNYEEYLPKYFYFIDECGLLPLEGNPISYDSVRVPISAFFSTLQEYGILCLKHTHSSVGKGFMLVKQEKDKFFLNNKIISNTELTELISSLRQYIVTEFVVQHAYASKICSTSLNTIRFLCVWDETKKEFFLARCFHRFGCNGNIVDNIGSGNGILVFVDVESGKLKAEGSKNYNHEGDQYVENLVHPDHNIQLSGIQIPNFKQVKSKILEIANANSFMRYLGFDVAITENGFKIIELNSLSSLDVTQQREGFLFDPRIRKVLKK